MSSSAIRRAAPANPVQAAVATAQVFSLASNSVLACTVPLPGKLALENKKFNVRAEGNALTAGATTTVQASLLAATVLPATPLTIGNWTLIGAGTAQVVNTTWAPWYIEANLIVDSRSGNMQGTFSQMINNLYNAFAAITNQVTGINGTLGTVTQGATPVPPADPIAFFAVALTFSVAAAGNAGYLANFEVGF